MNTVRVVSDFFNNSPKRFDLITKKIKESNPRVSHTKLTDVCRTCWLARIDGLEIFIELFVAVVKSLEVIKDNAGGSWNADSIWDASGLFHSNFVSIHNLSGSCLSHA